MPAAMWNDRACGRRRISEPERPRWMLLGFRSARPIADRFPPREALRDERIESARVLVPGSAQLRPRRSSTPGPDHQHLRRSRYRWRYPVRACPTDCRKRFENMAQLNRQTDRRCPWRRPSEGAVPETEEAAPGKAG